MGRVGFPWYMKIWYLGECFVFFSGCFFSILMVFGDFNNAMLSVLLVYKIVCCFEFFGNESDVAKFGNFCGLGFLIQYGDPWFISKRLGWNTLMSFPRPCQGNLLTCLIRLVSTTNVNSEWFFLPPKKYILVTTPSLHQLAIFHVGSFMWIYCINLYKKSSFSPTTGNVEADVFTSPGHHFCRFGFQRETNSGERVRLVTWSKWSCCHGGETLGTTTWRKSSQLLGWTHGS